MEVINAIQKQVDAASSILQKILFMRPIPERSNLSPDRQTSGKTRYDKTEVKLIEEEIDKWQHSTRAVLAACFPGDNEHKYAFERTIVSPRVYFDAKEELDKEVKEGRDVLSAIIEEVSLKMKLNPGTISKDATTKTGKRPLVFISHRGSQETFVTALVSLLERCGFTNENLFCSSVPGYNIGLDEDIIETLKKKFLDYDIYVVYVFSTDFFDSAYCLNEMGAAWVLQVDNSIIITRDMDESKIDGVVEKKKTRVSFKESDIKLQSRMIELRNKLTDFAGLNRVDEIDWLRYYPEFIEKLKSKEPQNPHPTDRQIPSNPALTTTTESIDSFVNKAINKLDEFTIKDLEDETGIKDKGFLRRKIDAMVKTGELEAIGSTAHRKYRRIIISNPLF